MSFLHPWAVVAAGIAVGLPIAVHLLTRPRPVKVPLSTVRFVREAIRQRRARSRLRDFVILALRMLAVLLVGWAIARPLLGGKPLVSGDETVDTARVVVFDASASMAAGSHGVPLIETARARAGNYLTFRPGLRSDLIIAGAGASSTYESPSPNVGGLREQLADARTLPEAFDVQRALRTASEVLARAPGADLRRELIVVSDFQRTNWAQADFGVLPEQTQIQLESPLSGDDGGLRRLDNLAILEIATRGKAMAESELPVDVVVGNYTDAPRRVTVQLTVGDAKVRLEDVCAPKSKTTLTGTLALREAGWQAGEARFVGVEDALPSDDWRPFVFEVRRQPTYALLTRQTGERVGGADYLELALAPHSLREKFRGPQVSRRLPEEFRTEDASAADLLVLYKPGRMSEDRLRLLISLARRGRPLLYVVSELADATNLKLIQQYAGASFQPPVELLPPEPGTIRRDLALLSVKRDEKPFRELGDELPTIIAPLRFSGGLTSRRIQETLDDDILAAFSDRSAFLYHTQLGAGSVAVMNADLDATNLVASPLFVPLVSELLDRMQARGAAQPERPCGELLVERLPPEITSTEGLVVGPDEGSTPGELSTDSGGVFWRWEDPGPPGVFRIMRGSETVYAAAVTTPAEESELRPLDPKLLTDSIAGGRAVHFNAANDAHRGDDRSWAWFATACILAMLGEVAALRGFNV